MYLLQRIAVHGSGMTSLVSGMAGSCLRKLSCQEVVSMHIVSIHAATSTFLVQLPAASPNQSYPALQRADLQHWDGGNRPGDSSGSVGNDVRVSCKRG